MPTLEALMDALDNVLMEVQELEDRGVEPPHDLLAQLESFVERTREKADAIGNTYLDYDERAGVCEKRADEYRDRARKLRNRQERMKRFVARLMTVKGYKKLEGVEATVTLLAGREKPLIDDPTALPDDCWREPPPPEKVIDLTGIKERLLKGEVIPGAHMGRGEPSLRVYR